MELLETTDIKKNVVQKRRVDKKEVRISLTEKCNLNCMFCHSEGLDSSIKRDKIDQDRLSLLLGQLVKNEYTDITFTGGEPLLKNQLLTDIIKNTLSRCEPLPDITVVTNGTYLDQQFLDVLSAYPGNKKINFSYHYFTADDFFRITSQPKKQFEKIKTNLELAASSDVPVKVNMVVLRNINNQDDYLQQMIDYLAKIGADSLKLLELLVPEGSAQLFDYYYETEGLELFLNQVADLSEIETRRKKYRLKKNHDFIIEVQRLTCKFGCEKCHLIRDRTIDSELNYFPCFVLNTQKIDLVDFDKINDYFSQGDALISKNIENFGNKSPILISEAEYVKKIRELYFYFNPNQYQSVIAKLKSADFTLVRMRNFRYKYYRPINPDKTWEKFERILSAGWDNSNTNKIHLIYTDCRYNYNQAGLLEVTKTFVEEKGPVVLNPTQYDIAKKLGEKIGVVCYFEYDFFLEEYANEELKLSISKGTEVCSVKIENYDNHRDKYQQLTELCNFKPIEQPLVQFLMEWENNCGKKQYDHR